MAIENVTLAPGRGRVTGTISVFLGALAVLAVLCFHFPEYLTTPELRQQYSVPVLRQVLQVSMVLSIILGALTILRWKSKRLGFLGIALTLLALWMGGANVQVNDFDQPDISFGLDWFVLALLVNTAVFVLIERVFPHEPEQLTLRKEWRLDLIYYAFNHLMISVILLVTTFFSEELFGWAVWDVLQEWVRAQPVWLQFFEVLLVADLVQYVGHRMMHEVPWLWNFHAVHHCPAKMDWLSGSRIHFLEVLFTRSTILLPIYLLGFSQGAVSVYVLWVGIQGVLIHANADLPVGPLKHLFVTPHFHHWHHSADEVAIDKNYAAHLSFLDRLFGTYVGDRPDWPTAYGVVGKPLPRGFVAQHLYPFIKPFQAVGAGERPAEGKDGA